MFDLLAWSPVISAIGVALIAGGYGFRQFRARSREPLPPTWPEMWEHGREQDEKIAALGRMLMTLLDQWPKGSSRPKFDDADIKLLEKTIPTARLRTRED